MTDVVALAAELLSIQSFTRDEGAAIDFVARWLVNRGWNVSVQEVSPGRGNVWASRRGGGVTLSTHLDTVPPFHPPRLSGNRLYGRGACDAKGIAAAMMAAAEQLHDAGESRVDLLFVVGEEKGSDGARAANNLAATSRFLINGEPTASRLASGCKGSLRFIVRTRGREAHSAYPELGRSAIEPLIRLLPTIHDVPFPSDAVLGATTVNIGTIAGGSEANIIPGSAESEVMLRLVSDVGPVKDLVSAWARAGDAEVEFGSTIPAQRFHVIDGYETAPVSYTSDIPLLGRWGTPLLFGPGSIHVAHTPDEFVDVDELRASVGAYAALVAQLLGP
ncbi:MAG: M20/M25/M40 family metallo-hydrolase [Gemmatimonadota bacterium]|nr:M20/M25/M40 family metallo-hydrolase [Gemmatimonadota bacterium]